MVLAASARAGYIIGAMQSASSPLQKLHNATEELLQLLERGNFYLELLFLSVGLSVSILLALLITSFTRRHLHTMPRLGLSPQSLAKPLALLLPLFIVIGLGSIKPIAEHVIGTLYLIPAAIELSVAWLLARATLLMVSARPIAWFIAVVIFAYGLLQATGFMPSTTAYLGSLGFEVGKYKMTVLGLLQGLIIFVIVFWMAGALSRTLENYLRRSSALSYNARELIMKFFTVFVYFIALIVTLGAVGVDMTALAVFGGALGIGVGLGLQKITANFVSGVTILLEKSIKIGDLVEVGNILGWVRQMQMRYTLVQTFDGRDILVPNEELLTSRVTNWTYSNYYARVEVRATVTYDSDAKKAQELMLECALTHPSCLREPEAWCYLREFTDHGLVLVLTFWIPDIRDGRYRPQSEIMFAIYEKFQEHSIRLFQAVGAIPAPMEAV